MGLDGGQDKCIVVIQMHDLANPDPTYFKDGGRRRSIIVARGMLDAGIYIIVMRFSLNTHSQCPCVSVFDELSLFR